MRPVTTILRLPRALPGNALLEFVLTLPILIFMTGLTIYMSMAMLTKQQTLVSSRHHLYTAAGHGRWSDMKLEGWVPSGSLGAQPDDGNMPRGTGQELDQLSGEVAPSTLAKVTNEKAKDYWARLWGNLPGRHETHSSKSFQTQGSLWNFIDRTAHADHWRDSSPWHFYHIDAWKIARSGPLAEIFMDFRDHLQGDVAPHFQETRDQILNRWWHQYDLWWYWEG